MVRIITAFAIAAAAATGLVAANTEKSSDLAAWEVKLEAAFAGMDVDRNGAVSEAEYIAYKTEEARRAFAELAGDDAAASLDEMRAAYLAREAADAAAATVEDAASSVEPQPEQ